MAHDKLAYDRAWRKKRREAGLPCSGARYWDPVKMAGMAHVLGADGFPCPKEE